MQVRGVKVKILIKAKSNATIDRNINRQLIEKTKRYSFSQNLANYGQLLFENTEQANVPLQFFTNIEK